MTEDIAAEIVGVLRHRPSALLTDIDGTISEIASTPEAAFAVQEARIALRKLATMIDIVGVVTGRSAENAQKMVTEPSLIYVGNHGLERSHKQVEWIHPEASGSLESVASALAELEMALLAEGLSEGLRFENKVVTASVHFRLSPQPEFVASRLMELAMQTAVAHDLRVTTGKMVVELRPQVQVNKGTILRDLAAEFGLRGMVYLGDDRTDVDGFLALNDLQSEGLATLSVAVLGPETPLEVQNSATRTVNGVAESVRLLEQVAAAMENN